MVKAATIEPELSATHTALLQWMARTLAHTTDSFAFLNAALEQLYATLHPAFAQVLLLNREQDELTLAAFVGHPPDAERLPLRLSPTMLELLGADLPALVARPASSALAADLGAPRGVAFEALLLIP